MENQDKNYNGGLNLGLKHKKSVGVVTFVLALCGVLRVWLTCTEVKSLAVVLTICFVTVVMASVVVYFCWLQFKTDGGGK